MPSAPPKPKQAPPKPKQTATAATGAGSTNPFFAPNVSIGNILLLVASVLAKRSAAVKKQLQGYVNMVAQKNLETDNITKAMAAFNAHADTTNTSAKTDPKDITFQYEYKDPSTGATKTKTMKGSDYLKQLGISGYTGKQDTTEMAAVVTALKDKADSLNTDTKQITIEVQDLSSKLQQTQEQQSTLINDNKSIMSAIDRNL